MLLQAMTNGEILNMLGSRLREFRLKANVSQRDVAEKTGIGVSSINKIENGEPVSMNILISYLRALKLLDGLQNLVPQEVAGPSDLLRDGGLKRQKAGRKKTVLPKNYFE